MCECRVFCADRNYAAQRCNHWKNSPLNPAQHLDAHHRNSMVLSPTVIFFVPSWRAISRHRLMAPGPELCRHISSGPESGSRTKMSKGETVPAGALLCHRADETSLLTVGRPSWARKSTGSSPRRVVLARRILATCTYGASKTTRQSLAGD